MKKFLILLVVVFSTLSCSKDFDDNLSIYGTVRDADGNTYQTIKIGNQTWMLENLKTTKYNDGQPITLYSFATHGINWLNFNQSNAFYQWAETSDLNNIYPNNLPQDYYGAMYNHLAIESGKLAPLGWRIPSQSDFQELENYLNQNGYANNEGLTLKTDFGWLPSSGNGTDAINFRGLPNGYVSAFGTPTFAEGVCTWATSDVTYTNPNQTSGNRVMIQLFDTPTIQYIDNPIQIGAGIRCIKN